MWYFSSILLAFMLYETWGLAWTLMALCNVYTIVSGFFEFLKQVKSILDIVSEDLDVLQSWITP